MMYKLPAVTVAPLVGNKSIGPTSFVLIVSLGQLLMNAIFCLCSSKRAQVNICIHLGAQSLYEYQYCCRTNCTHGNQKMCMSLGLEIDMLKGLLQ